MFVVVVINERTGQESRMSSPLTHAEGCTFLTKLMQRKHTRNCLQDASTWAVDEWDRIDPTKRVT